MEGHASTSEKDYSKARSLCGDHLGGPWTQDNSIDTRLLTGGVLNKIILCSLKTGQDENGRNKVLVRQFATSFGETDIGEAAQAVGFEAFHRAGLGPKLLGVFKGGRIEEFVPSRMSNYKDARTPDGLRVIARLTARMHSLEVPLKRNPDVFINNYITYYSQTKQRRANFDLSLFPVDVHEKLKRVVAFDVIGELKFAVECMKKVKSRVVLTHFDHHANNFLIKNDARTPLSEDDAMVIDMDSLTYYYRGMDIGVYLFESSFDYADIVNLKLVDMLPDSSWRSFVADYLEAWKEHNPDKFDPEIDNVENIFVEAQILCTVFSLAWIDYVLEKLVSDHSIIEGIRGYLDIVSEHRIPLHFKLKANALESLNKLNGN